MFYTVVFIKTSLEHPFYRELYVGNKISFLGEIAMEILLSLEQGNIRAIRIHKCFHYLSTHRFLSAKYVPLLDKISF